MLEVAGELLRAQQVGVELQQQIARRAEEMRPALACELVALPLARFQVGPSRGHDQQGLCRLGQWGGREAGDCVSAVG